MRNIFSGYQTSLPIWVYFVLLAAAVVLSWWSYKETVTRYDYLKYVLVSLRSIVFLLLLLVLINPVFEQIKHIETKPDIAVLLDNSKSMSIKKGKFDGRKTYENVLNALNLQDSSAIRFDAFSFDQKIKRVSADSLTLNGNETDLSHAFSYLSNSGNDYKAIILVSDGIYTIGKDPSFQASNLGYPVYCVAMGDTIHKNDIIVQSISAPHSGYKNTIIPIDATIINDGFPGKKIQVQLVHDGKIIEKKFIESRLNKSAQSITFHFKPDKTGLQQYQIIVPGLNGEWTTLNNKKIFDINIRNDKIKILDLAFTIHPDVKTVRSIMESDKSIEIKELTWIGGQKFLGGSLPSQIDTMNLVILHGYPGKRLPDSEATTIHNLIKNKPILLISGPETDYQRLNTLFSGQLPIVTGDHNSLADIQLSVNPNNSENPVLNLPSFNITKLPPVFAPIQNTHPSPGSSVLFDAVYHNTQTKAPVIALRSLGNQRIAQMNISGFFQWYQNDVQGSREYVINLINNLVKWTSAKPDNRLLKISPANKIFNASEDAILNASLINESGLPEDKGQIRVKINGSDYPARTFIMNNQGLGRYDLNVGVLPGGLYQFKATASVGTRIIDKENGQFSVGSTNAEFVNTTRNDALLHFISKNSGGQYFTFNHADEVLPALHSKGILKPVIHSERSKLYLYRSPWWFAIILLLLTTEWFIRKYLALP